MAKRFQEVISTEEQLREVLGKTPRGSLAKAIDHIDEHFAGFIAKSPFVLIGSSDGAGNQDVSPKGDPAGFVQMLDQHTLAIPDRPGNRRGDTFSNVLQDPHVALFFLVPGVRETLRVQGTATIVRDLWLRERMTVQGHVPELALVVDVAEAFMHCAKCVVRSHLWEHEDWPDPADIPNLAAALVDQMNLAVTKEEIVASLDQDARENLYSKPAR
ncbi:MAG: MSMEG_1061 family FMN-dependent PPOX-type flavoprotein [Dehalococcoidia bacterium]